MPTPRINETNANFDTTISGSQNRNNKLNKNQAPHPYQEGEIHKGVHHLWNTTPSNLPSDNLKWTFPEAIDDLLLNTSSDSEGQLRSRLSECSFSSHVDVPTPTVRLTLGRTLSENSTTPAQQPIDTQPIVNRVPPARQQLPTHTPVVLPRFLTNREKVTLRNIHRRSCENPIFAAMRRSVER